MNFIVRPSRADEWQVLKHLRISALTQDPDAFGPTAQEALTFDDGYWQRFAAYFESSWRHMFIALTEQHSGEASRDSASENASENGPVGRHVHTHSRPPTKSIADACGLISAVVDRERSGHLGAFWVDPRTRGSGLGAKLFDAALLWLENDLHCPRVELSVTEGNEQAEAMYRRRGFTRSGKFESLREGSRLRNVYMTKIVGPHQSI